MKNLITVVLLGLTLTPAFAQDEIVNFGIKAGINYGDNGEIEAADFTNLSNSILSEKGEDRAGFHIGMFVRVALTDYLFLRPELQYTQTSTAYDILGFGTSYKLDKLDMPLLAGVKIVGPVYLLGGPSLQYIVNNDLKDVEIDEVKNEFTVGLQFGLGVQLGRFNADIRYESGLNDNQAESLEAVAPINTDVRVDSRPNQWILSVGIDL